MSERRIEMLLLDIQQSIENILLFTQDLSFPEYANDLKTKHAVQHNFVIIGEAVGRNPVEFKTKHNHINWRHVKDFRNVVVHDYFGLDDSIIWDIIQFNLVDLLSEVKKLNIPYDKD